MDIIGKLVERSHLALVVIGAILLLVASVSGGSSLGNLTLVIELAWRYVLASIGIVLLGIGLYLVIRRGDSETKKGIKKTKDSRELNTKTTSPQHLHSADFDKFLEQGMVMLHNNLTYKDIGALLEKARDIRVLKTWFPEHPQIEDGLESAIIKGAKVRLLLCKPNSVLLKQRSLGAGEHVSEGPHRVYRVVERVHKLVTTTPRTDVQIACYESWPGCPVIWYDNEILMGFYFRGKSSPKWPWISVKTGSKLAKTLDDQFNGLWEHTNAETPDTPTEKLDTPEKMAIWLEVNKLATE